jgi:LacI family transcriptional regulator
MICSPYQDSHYWPSMAKYLEVSQQLETRLLAGHWEKGRVPSVRAVAEQYRVSAVTAARALQLLRDKGLIHTVERSGCFRIPTPAGERWGLCLRITPGPWQEFSTSLSRVGFEAVASREGVFFDDNPFNWHAGITERDLDCQIRAAIASGVRGVALLPSRLDEALAHQDEQFVAACVRHGLPVVLVERNLRGLSRPLPCDLVTTDDLLGGITCTRHLLGLERTRVAFIGGSPTSSHEARAAGYLLTLYQAALSPLILEEPAANRDGFRHLADRLIDWGADGVVCYQDYVALGLIVEFMARGRRIPADIAIVGFDDLPLGTSFAVSISTYAFPAEAVAQETLRLLRQRAAGDDSPPIHVVVPGTFYVRESSMGRCTEVRA